MNCSAFHKGRLRITFDPLGNASASADTQMTCFTKIVDIEPSTDVEIRVPYQQYRAWLTTFRFAKHMTATNTPYGASVGNNHSVGNTNGTISVRVQTALTSPLAAASVDVLVFVRGAENLEFAMPCAELYKDVSIGAALQDGNLSNDSDTTVEVGIGHCPAPADQIYLTYMGEQVASLRTVLHRMCTVTSIKRTVTANYQTILTTQFLRTPARLGFHSSGFTNVEGLIDGENDYKFNWCQPHWLGIISAPFLGNRGSVNWSVVHNGGSNNGNPLKVTRHAGITNALIIALSSDSTNTESGNAKFKYSNYLADGNGAGITHTKTNTGLNFQVPFYSAFKFAPNAFGASLTSTENNSIIEDGFSVTYEGNNGAGIGTLNLDYLAGAGPDYTLVHFLMVPSMSVMTTLPTPAADS
jgi:hypothetical protein